VGTGSREENASIERLFLLDQIVLEDRHLELE